MLGQFFYQFTCTGGRELNVAEYDERGDIQVVVYLAYRQPALKSGDPQRIVRISVDVYFDMSCSFYKRRSPISRPERM